MAADGTDAGSLGTADPELRGAGRFLRIMAATAGALVLVVIVINLVALGVMTRPENASVVQLLAGWGRSYKPILYDIMKPEVAVFGSSIARDAFDPVEVEKIIGMTVFNHAVSGGAPYENRRFAQSAFENNRLKALILNLDSFDAGPGQNKSQYGFDESILNLRPDGEPSRNVLLNRAYALTLAGSAIGYNLDLFLTLARMASGETKEQVLSSYESRDNRQHEEEVATARARIFPMRVRSSQPSATSVLPTSVDMNRFGELAAILDLYCSREIDIYLYFTPYPFGRCRMDLDFRLEALALLKERQRACRSSYHLFDFQYPNAVTLEGIATPVPVSKYFRPDGHPRPTMGQLMAAVMFDRPMPKDTARSIAADFGTDLLRHPAPVEWTERRLARCDGRWMGSDASVVTDGAIPSAAGSAISSPKG